MSIKKDLGHLPKSVYCIFVFTILANAAVTYLMLVYFQQ